MRWGKLMGWAVVFSAGLLAGFAAAKGKGIEPSIYQGKEARQAGLALLQEAEVQAGNGSWERIGVGRVYYLSGDRAKGQALFDGVLAKKPAKDDLQRIARVYAEAGEWDKAEPLYQQALAKDPGDDSIRAEEGAYYNLNGNRSKAEELFGLSLGKKSDVWNTLDAAGSYLGVKPD
ncbi:MAG: tetratricopeptide repeat protein [Acidobacteriota bacterium]